jgi:uncharacterized protein (TIGR02145 family)
VVAVKSGCFCASSFVFIFVQNITMRLTITTLALLISALIIAQAPALIPYQAIARNEAGEPLASSTLNARFTMHDGTASGEVVWQELQTVNTSALGLFTAQLGSSVSLIDVNWDGGAKFIQVELDLGNGFIDIGTQQLLSVPYALHAGSVHLDVSATGDTLFVGDGSFVIIPGISEANGFTTGTTFHSCGAPNVHNPDLTYGSMTDQEGYVYKTIVIGTQEWMAENLNTSIYRNGDAIVTDLDNATWQTTTDGAWTYSNNDPSNACPFGKLYNGYAAIDSRQLCPSGWHVPSQTEWVVLIDFLGGPGTISASAMKSSQIDYWGINNSGLNSSGFSALPTAIFDGIDYYSLGSTWWSTTGYGNGCPCGFYLNIENTSLYLGGGNYPFYNNGHGIRCIRD